MAGPWEQYQTEKPEPGPWAKFAEAKPKRVQGSFLPISMDESGENVQFDPQAGVLGSLISAFNAPGDVASGKIDAFGPEGAARAREMAGVISPTPAAMRVARKVIPTPPSAQALKDAGSEGFETVRGLGVDYSAAAAKSLSEGIQRNLESDGVLAELSPKTFSILKKLQEPPEGSVASLNGIIAARRSLENAAKDFSNPTERLAATRAIKELDGFIQAADPQTLAPRPAAPTGTTLPAIPGEGVGAAGGIGEARRSAEAAASTIRDANANYAAAKRGNKISGDLDQAYTGAVERAELNAGAANSGQNFANAVRQRIKAILADPKQARGYNEEELKAMRNIVMGTPVTNSTRFVANLLGGGGGLGTATTAAFGGAGTFMATGSPWAGVAALPLVGVGLKKAEQSLVNRQVANLDAQLRSRSPLYEQMLADAPIENISPEARMLLLRAMMLDPPASGDR